jgi:hypothetical protein
VHSNETQSVNLGENYSAVAATMLKKIVSEGPECLVFHELQSQSCIFVG